MEAEEPARIRVLVVDDHPLVSETVVRVLELDPAIDVIGTAPTAADGLARIRSDQPDVVVMDFQLPDFNGAEATRIVRLDNPNIRVVGMTASDIPGAYEAAHNAGVSAWIMKAQAVRELRDAVHRVHAGETLLPEK